MPENTYPIKNAPIPIPLIIKSFLLLSSFIDMPLLYFSVNLKPITITVLYYYQYIINILKCQWFWNWPTGIKLIKKNKIGQEKFLPFTKEIKRLILV